MAYYLLTGLNQYASKHEVIFGDHELDVVKEEKSNTHDYKQMKVHTLKDCDQSSIDSIVNQLNK